MQTGEFDGPVTERELNELQQWLQHSAPDRLADQRYTRLAAALLQLRTSSSALRRENGRLRERIRQQSGRHNDLVPLRERRAASRHG